MSLKSQISLFLILGLVLAFVAGIGFFYVNNIKQPDDNIISQSQSVNQYVGSCLELVAEEGLKILGIQGGHISLQEPYFKAKTYNTSYLYYERGNLLPSLQDIEKELADYADNNIERCAHFSDFKGVKIDTKQKQSKVEITKDKVIFNLNWQIIISVGESIKEIHDFSVDIDIKFYDVYQAVSSIVKSTEKSPKSIDNILLIYQNVSSIDYIIENKSIVYLITQNISNLKEPYYFLFAVKVPQETSIKIIVEEILQLKATVGQQFTYQVKAKNTGNTKLSFELVSPLFEINNSTGVINFTPTKLQKGNHFAALYVKDSQNNEASKIINFLISENEQMPELILENKTISLGEEFFYEPYIKNNINAKLEFVEAPQEMSIDGNSINWIPEKKGNYSVRLKFSDGVYSSQNQFTVEVK